MRRRVALEIVVSEDHEIMVIVVCSLMTYC